MDITTSRKQIRSADMTLQWELRAILKGQGYRPPLDIRYVRRGGGEPLDAAVIYGASETNGEPALALYAVNEDGQWVCTWERE